MTNTLHTLDTTSSRTGVQFCVDYKGRREADGAMLTGVAIQRGKQCVFSSDPDVDALGHLEQMVRMGVNASGFRIASGVILLVGDSLRTVILEERKTES
jgi:hypothetical protein